jgi:ATP-dependent DNA ligase
MSRQTAGQRLAFHRGQPCFFAFDLLMSDGKDLRLEIDRPETRTAVPPIQDPGIENAVRRTHRAAWDGIVRTGLSDGSRGIVAKHSFGKYVTEHERTTWFEIKNRNYSQMAERGKLFERERHKEPVAGWHCCELTCAEVEL